MASNHQKGLFRIYIVLNAVTVSALLCVFQNDMGYFSPVNMIRDYWPGFVIMLLSCALPWTIHFVVKWIIRGFKGGNCA